MNKRLWKTVILMSLVRKYRQATQVIVVDVIPVVGQFYICIPSLDKNGYT